MNTALVQSFDHDAMADFLFWQSLSCVFVQNKLSLNNATFKNLFTKSGSSDFLVFPDF